MQLSMHTIITRNLKLFVASFLFSTIFLYPVVTHADAIYGKQKVKSAFDAAQTSRVDFVGIGDSNQIKDGTGWDHGFQYALENKYGLYATELLSVNENQGFGAGAGYTYQRFGVPTGATAGAPSELAAFLDKGAGGLNPANYGYIAPSTTISTNPMGLILDANNVLGSERNLVGQYFYGNFATTTGTTTVSSGSFRPTVRLNHPPYSILLQTQTIQSSADMYGMALTELSLPASPTRTGQPLQFQWVQSGGSIVGPWFGLYTRVHSPEITTGASYHTLDFRGGQSLRIMAYDLQQAADTTLSYYFSLVRSLQFGQKRVVAVINSGVNDRNDTNLSVGPLPTQSNTPSGYSDNLRAIVSRIENIWQSNNWSLSELFFVVIPSHAVSTPEDAQLMSYRTAAQTVSDTHPRMAVVDMSQIANEAEMTANSWYQTPADHYHLTRQGYENLSARILNVFTAGKSSSVNSQVIKTVTPDCDC
jgi:lysophospholipase L1-like esterase